MMSPSIGTKSPKAAAKSTASVDGELIHVHPGVNVIVTSCALALMLAAIIASKHTIIKAIFFIVIINLVHTYHFCLEPLPLLYNATKVAK
jgi:glycerol-3-phosphate acyltransferase PlsY